MAYETPLTIAEVINDISANKYVLPAIQREFVWSTSQIERLFDSIMQEYPIGSFLFWELTDEQYTQYDFYSFLQNYHEKKARHNPKINLAGNHNVMAVLDGQQRLTSLYIALKGTYAYKLSYKQWKNDAAFPKRRLYLNLVEPCSDGNNRYQFSFLTEEDAVNDSNHYWFPVGDIMKMSDLGEVMTYLMKNIAYGSIYSQEQGMFATDALPQLYKVIHTQPTISYYKIKSKELDKVLNIFIRVNSGGTVLSYSDLLLSIATAQWENLDAREEITECVDDINAIGTGFNVNKDFVLKACLVLSDFSAIAFKVDNFTKQNMLIIEQNWKTIKTSLMQAFTLISYLGFSRDNLSSNNAVIPIAYYLKRMGNPAIFETSSAAAANREKIKKWLIMALIKRIFGGQADNVLRQIREIIIANEKKDFPIDEIINKLRGTDKSLIFNNDDIENLLDHQYGKADTLTVLMLLYPSLDYSQKFHNDHIYPKSKFTKKGLQKKGISEADSIKYINDVNSLSNLELLQAIPNIEKQDTDFDEWFVKTYPTEKDKISYRKMNYLPDMDYTYANFEKFLEERRKAMKAELEKTLL